jgi:hypothetical protein
MTKDEFVKVFSGAVQYVLQDCVDRDFQLPLHYVLLAVNGSASVLRAESENALVLTDYYHPEGWRMPTTITVVDSRGKASVFALKTIGGAIERVL